MAKGKAVEEAERTLAVARAVVAVFPDADRGDYWQSALVVDHAEARMVVFANDGATFRLRVEVEVPGERSVDVYQRADPRWTGVLQCSLAEVFHRVDKLEPLRRDLAGIAVAVAREQYEKGKARK